MLIGERKFMLQTKKRLEVPTLSLETSGNLGCGA